MSDQQHTSNNFKITENKAQSESTNPEMNTIRSAVSVTAASTSNVQPDAANQMTNLMRQTNLSPESSEDNLCRPDWLKARDSLENLIVTRNEKAFGEIPNSKSTSFPLHKNTMGHNEAPHSDSDLAPNKPPASASISKVLTWDPWEKLGRKKEVKRRPIEGNVESIRKDCTAGDELRAAVTADIDTAEASVADTESYVYQPYRPKNSKSVEFTNEVQVVYITADKIVGQTREPLKKELDQQIRNKEMRRGHSDEFMQQRTSVWSNRRLAFQ